MKVFYATVPMLIPMSHTLLSDDISQVVLAGFLQEHLEHEIAYLQGSFIVLPLKIRTLTRFN